MRALSDSTFLRRTIRAWAGFAAVALVITASAAMAADAPAPSPATASPPTKAVVVKRPLLLYYLPEPAGAVKPESKAVETLMQAAVNRLRAQFEVRSATLPNPDLGAKNLPASSDHLKTLARDQGIPAVITLQMAVDEKPTPDGFSLITVRFRFQGYDLDKGDQFLVEVRKKGSLPSRGGDSALEDTVRRVVETEGMAAMGAITEQISTHFFPQKNFWTEQ